MQRRLGALIVVVAMSGLIHSADNSQTQLLVLQAWWKRHCKVFSTWWLCATAETRLEVLLAASPDMPAVNSAARAQSGESLKPTDLLLPELSQDALMASGGRLLALFFTKRLTPSDLGFAYDLSFLKALRLAGTLPVLSGALRDVEDPVVDPLDPNEAVIALTHTGESEEEQRDIKKRLLEDIDANLLVRADVWLAFRLRRDLISDFIKFVILDVEERVASECAKTGELNVLVPSYAALHQAEEEMLKLEASATEVTVADS